MPIGMENEDTKKHETKRAERMGQTMTTDKPMPSIFQDVFATADIPAGPVGERRQIVGFALMGRHVRCVHSDDGSTCAFSTQDEPSGMTAESYDEAKTKLEAVDRIDRFRSIYATDCYKFAQIGNIHDPEDLIDS